MFTLTAIILVALLGGIYFKIAKYLSKKKESIRQVRKVYNDDVLKAYAKGCTYDQVIIGEEEAELHSKYGLRRKKITKSKFIKRLV